MSKKLKKVKGRREEKNHDHLCKQLLDEDGNVIVDFDKDIPALGALLVDCLNDEADLHGHPIEALDKIEQNTEYYFDGAEYFFELIDTDTEREMLKVRYVVEDWMDKEAAQRLIAKLQGV